MNHKEAMHAKTERERVSHFHLLLFKSLGNLSHWAYFNLVTFKCKPTDHLQFHVNYALKPKFKSLKMKRTIKKF